MNKRLFGLIETQLMFSFTGVNLWNEITKARRKARKDLWNEIAKARRKARKDLWNEIAKARRKARKDLWNEIAKTRRKARKDLRNKIAKYCPCTVSFGKKICRKTWNFFLNKLKPGSSEIFTIVS